MILSVAKIEDFDQFWGVFSTKGAAKRKEHGSKGSYVFRDPDDPNRVLVVFDWDTDSYKEFIQDPEMKEIFKEGGLKEQPKPAELAGEHEA
jgi:heme-degrading monooxygenase HmoA